VTSDVTFRRNAAIKTSVEGGFRQRSGDAEVRG
jgi:hypothetical protein